MLLRLLTVLIAAFVLAGCESAQESDGSTESSTTEVAQVAEENVAAASDAEPAEAESEELKQGKLMTQAHCSACHSLSIVAQNRFDREGWEKIIRLMQDQHGLWDLGDAESQVLDYLEHVYGVKPATSIRRKNLQAP